MQEQSISATTPSRVNKSTPTPTPRSCRTAWREIGRDDCGLQAAGLIMISPLELIYSFMLVPNYSGSFCSLRSRW